MFTITKAQLHVSAIYVDHLQVVHEELINKLHQRVWGGCEISFCGGERGVNWGCLGNCVKVTSMSTYSYVVVP